MKKLLLLVGLICCIGSVSAQTKTAYCDVYMRGGYDCMTVTIMFDSDSHRLNRSYSMGEILNIMAEDGWILDNDIVIPRHPWFSYFTRHKLHLIMKKEYNKGEDPFAFIKLFCQKKAHIDEVKEDTERVIETKVEEQVAKKTKVKEPVIKEVVSTKEKNNTEAEVSSVPKMVNAKYKDLDVIVINESKNDVVILLNSMLCDTWQNAMNYCKTMGAEWHLSDAKIVKLMDKVEDFWMNQDIDDNIAYFYDTSAKFKRQANKNHIMRFYPVARVSKSEITYIE